MLITPFLVVTGGAYGISFKVVLCHNSDEALSMVCGNDSWHRSISHVIDMDKLVEDSVGYGIIYEELPTGG